jgi:iron(III) transport system substrate-binding protein
MKKRIHYLILLLILIISAAASDTALSQEIVVYSARKEHLIKPVFDLYTKETGVKIKFITDKAPVLLQRIIAEGDNTPADLLITVDAGNLWHAGKATRGYYNQLIQMC